MMMVVVVVISVSVFVLIQQYFFAHPLLFPQWHAADFQHPLSTEAKAALCTVRHRPLAALHALNDRHTVLHVHRHSPGQWPLLQP